MDCLNKQKDDKVKHKTRHFTHRSQEIDFFMFEFLFANFEENSPLPKMTKLGSSKALHCAYH